MGDADLCLTHLRVVYAAAFEETTMIANLTSHAIVEAASARLTAEAGY